MVNHQTPAQYTGIVSMKCSHIPIVLDLKLTVYTL